MPQFGQNVPQFCTLIGAFIAAQSHLDGWHESFNNYNVENNVSLKLNESMRSLLYIIAVVLIIGWLIGAFAYSASGLIHILLVLAVVVIAIRLIQGRRI